MTLIGWISLFLWVLLFIRLWFIRAPKPEPKLPKGYLTIASFDLPVMDVWFEGGDMVFSCDIPKTMATPHDSKGWLLFDKDWLPIATNTTDFNGNLNLTPGDHLVCRVTMEIKT